MPADGPGLADQEQHHRDHDLQLPCLTGNVGDYAAGTIAGAIDFGDKISDIANPFCWVLSWCSSEPKLVNNDMSSLGADPTTTDYGSGVEFGFTGASLAVTAGVGDETLPNDDFGGLTGGGVPLAPTVAASSASSEELLADAATDAGEATRNANAMAAKDAEADATTASKAGKGTSKAHTDGGGSGGNGSGSGGSAGNGDSTGSGVGPKCSFAPSTPVLLADGKTKSIASLKVGDKVESANPNTGKEEGGRAVQHIWINHDTDLLDVTVSTGHGHTAVIHTTANHPFWDETTHAWVAAGELKPGHQLASVGNQHPIVVSVKVTPGAANRWNLTVQQLHTYYVVAGGTPILVHNTNNGLCEIGPSQTATQLRNAPGPATGGYSLADAGSSWLRGSSGNFGRIPGQVADLLRGQSFNGFDSFREAFWKAVGNDSDLSSGFSSGNVTRMQSGRSPFVTSDQSVPGGYNYVLHHAYPIWAGGGVYDMDNIVIVTPRLHSEILDGGFHYGW